MKTKEDKTQLKQQLLNQCIVKQQALIDDFSARLNELKLLQGNENSDSSNGSSKAFSQSEYNSIYQAFDFAKAEMDILKFLVSKEESIHQFVKLGSVVNTDKALFYISVSIEQFSVNGMDYIGISTHSPLYQAMRNKKNNDKFSYEGVDYLIKEVF